MKKIHLLLLLCLVLVMALFVSCTGSSSSGETEAQTSLVTEAESDVGTDPESIPPIESATPQETEMPESETGPIETDPSASPKKIVFDAENDLSCLSTKDCTAERFEDEEYGSVVKIKVTGRQMQTDIGYGAYMTAAGADPVRVEECRYVMLTFKVTKDAEIAFTLDCTSGDKTAFDPGGRLKMIRQVSAGWQVVMFDLSSTTWSGPLQNLLVTATSRQASEYYLHSLAFANSVIEVMEAMGDEDSLKSLYTPLTESKIDGVNLDKRNAPDEDAAVDMWFDHVSERKVQNDTTSSGMHSYLIRMPGNSIEGCQFFLAPEGDRTFSLSLTEFSNGKGNTLRTELFYERYYLVDGTMVPDALPPLTGDIQVSAGNSQGFYIKVWADADEVAGLYTADLTVKDAATGKVIKVATVYTYVWDFSLSEETALKTAVGTSSGHLQTSYVTEHNMTDVSVGELYKRYYDFLLENRLCGYIMPYTFTNENVWEYINNPRVNTFQIKTKDAAAAYALLSGNPEAAKKAYFYPIDEPTNMTGLNKLKDLTTELDTIYPDNRVISPFFTNINVDDSTDQVGFMSNYLNIWNTKVFAFTPRKYDFIPGVQYLMTKEQEDRFGTFSERMEKEVAGGDDLWVYFCWEPGSPYTNWLLTGDGTEPIVSIWQCRNTKCTGILYWATTKWTENLSTSPAGVEVWGDGCLMHSGAEYGLYEPVSSLRLENIRDGIQDYQMLHMVEEMAGAEAADELTALVSVNVLAYTSDDDHLHAARVLLGERVESLMKN